MSSHHRQANGVTSSLKISSRGALCACIVLLSLLLSLAACGASSTSGKIQLTMWYWEGAMDDNVVAAVNQHFPNIHLDAQKINGDSNTAIRTAMAGHSGVPDIVGFRGDDSTAGYFQDEDQFYDLKSLGANNVASEYLPWKWDLGISPDGKMIGFPIDTGPTALFYREDIFAKAGLPTDPQQVSNMLKTWDDYLQAAQKVKTATHGKSFMLDNITTVYTQMLAQSSQQYFDKNGKYTGDQSYMKQIWDAAVKAHTQNLTAAVPMWGQEWTQGMGTGLIASFVGAAWLKASIEQDAPGTKGLWRVAIAPGGAGNAGGSALGITKYCLHPKEALQVIEWLQSPQNQLVAYKDDGLYPSTIEALNDPKMHQSEPFFGGQDTTQIFATAAKEVLPRYLSPNDGDAINGFDDQLNFVEFQNKNPDQAWADAQTEVQRALLR